MTGTSTYTPKTGFTRWLDQRLPLVRLGYDSFIAFPTPRNLNYWWTFGAILTMMLAIMIITGIVLAMHYVASTALAFNSVEHIMRDVNYGWLLRYAHMNGASLFFIAVYIHIFRGLYYGSYKAPREVLWILGVLIFLLMIATAFLGYTLPWGQMSFWGATVITNLFAAIPLVGPSIQEWLWGGFAVGDPTLNRFFSLHYLFPFLIAAVVVLHIWALHVPGNNNPLGINVKGPQDTVPFHPFYTTKDLFAAVCYLIFFAALIFYAPNYLGEPDNYTMANPMVTPPHIVPEWYLLPFYAILRSIPDVLFIPAKLAGVIAMFAAIFVLFFLPWLDTSRVRSGRFRPAFKIYFWLLVVTCFVLGWVGKNPPDTVVFKTGDNTAAIAAALGSEIKAKGNAAVYDRLKAARDPSVADLKIFAEEAGIPEKTFEDLVHANPLAFRASDLGLVFTIYYFAYFLLILPVLGIVERPKPVPDSIAKAVLPPGTAAATAAAE